MLTGNHSLEPWWEKPAKEAALAIVEMEGTYSKDYAWRRIQARRLAGMYHGRNLDAPFTNDARFSWRDERLSAADDSYVPLIRNKAYEYVETHVSKIGADDAPQPALMVTDGDWDLKRRVELCSRILLAEYGMRQGRFSNVHDLCHQGLRMADAALGTVAAKVYPWPEEDRVIVELHDTLDMFLDDTELSYGTPRTFGEVTWWPPHRLAKSYPEHAERILESVEERRDRGGLVFAGRTARAELTPIWEAWAVKVGSEMGRHIVTLRDGTVLLDEEWDSDESPFAFLHTNPPLAGFWSIPMMEVAYEEIRKANEILYRCDEAHADTAKQVHYVHEASMADINDLLDVDTITVVKVKVPNYKPAVENPAPFNRIDLELLHEHEAGIAQTLGIDQMHSAARAEPGLPSGVAQREAGSRFDNRHAERQRGYVQWVAVDIARHMLRAQRKLYESNSAFKREWKGEFFSKEIEAKDLLDLDLEALHVQVKPISEKKNTPEERVQYAEELLEKGAIPFEAYLSAIQTYDTPGETKVVKTQRRWIAWQIDRWLMAEDHELGEPNFYQGPRPWMRKVDAMVQVVDSLMEAELSEVPQERLQYFLDFIAELSEQMAAEVTPPQAPQSPLGAPAPMQGSAGMNVGLGGSVGGAAPAPGAPPPGAAGGLPPTPQGL
jgi:hypothetical protein